MSINQVCISGNLCRDAEIRETASGQPIVSMTVAVNDRRKNPQSGQWEDFPNYVDCTMFGAYAKAIHPRLTKGAKVFVNGKLRWSQWEARDGSGKRQKLEVIAEAIETTSSERNAGSSYGEAYRAQRNAQTVTSQQPAQSGLYYDDVPF